MVPELGIGLVYAPELATIFEDTDLVGVLEIEPQGFWEKVAGPKGIRYLPNEALLTQAAQFPQAKLLHGVGQPVGGTVDDPVSYVEHLKHAVDLFDPAWISEHLSFSRTSVGNECQEAGFLLPPRQSEAGVNMAVHNIGRLSQGIGRPFAFETGVNYLKPRSDEFSDGAFFGEIAQRAECGILLDLHNLWCNERNGRQPVLDALAQMPLEQVWEVHLAGGMEYQGFWLDAHSDLVPPPVLDLAAQVIPRLPNLGAIIFEILPQHLSRVSVDDVHRQMETLSDLWSLKPARNIVPDQEMVRRTYSERREISATDSGEVAAWETSLVAAIRGARISHASYAGLGEEPGIDVLRLLIDDARRSNLVRSLRYTMTLLLLGFGPAETRALLDAYFSAQVPDMFPAIEADRFIGFLHGQPGVISRVPYLDEVLAFESALVQASVYETSTDLVWSTDPVALLSALDEGRAPLNLNSVRSTMRIAPA